MSRQTTITTTDTRKRMRNTTIPTRPIATAYGCDDGDDSSDDSDWRRAFDSESDAVGHSSAADLSSPVAHPSKRRRVGGRRSGSDSSNSSDTRTAEVACIRRNARPQQQQQQSSATCEPLGMQANAVSNAGDGTANFMCAQNDDDYQCRVCHIALSGALARAVTDSGAAHEDAREWNYHNGVATLFSIWRMYHAAERWGGRRALCESIARNWNTIFSKDDSAACEETDGNISSIGAALYERLGASNRHGLAAAAPTASDSDYESDLYDDDYDETIRSLYAGAGSEQAPAAAAATSNVNADGSVVEGLDVDVDVRISGDDVYEHFRRCTNSVCEVLGRDVDQLSQIQGVLYNNHLIGYEQDDILDDDDDNGNNNSAAAPVRQVVNRDGLNMYLSVVHTKNNLASTLLRAESTSMPCAYSLMSIRKSLTDSSSANDMSDSAAGLTNARGGGPGRLTGA